MTTAAEALRVIALIDAASTWKPRRTDDELADAVDDLVALLPGCPDGWAATATRDAIRDGETVTVATVASAWRVEQQRRLTEAGGSAPPEQLSADAGRWLAWQRARRRAVLAGATPEDADRQASVAVGVDPDLTPAPVDPVAAADARRTVRAAIAGWSAAHTVSTTDEEATR